MHTEEKRLMNEQILKARPIIDALEHLAVSPKPTTKEFAKVFSQVNEWDKVAVTGSGYPERQPLQKLRQSMLAICCQIMDKIAKTETTETD